MHFQLENMKELAGHWLIVNVIPNTGCNEICLDALLKTKQLRLMLNKELPRTRRVVIVFKEPAAEVGKSMVVERHAVMETAPYRKQGRQCTSFELAS